MKKSKIVLLTAVIGLTSLICAGSVCAFADTTETAAGIDNAHLIVIGCADVQGEADECVISGSIEAIGNDMADAEKRAAKFSQRRGKFSSPTAKFAKIITAYIPCTRATAIPQRAILLLRR